MEVLVTHEIERKKDGTKIVRNFFFNNGSKTSLTDAQSYFTKDEKKQAKLNYKANKSSLHREQMIEHFLKQPFPSWNIRFSILK